MFDICQRYEAQSESALQDKRCGRPLGTLRAADWFRVTTPAEFADAVLFFLSP